MKRLKLLPIIIMLIAGLITCAIAIIKHFDNTYALTALFIVLLTFYIIGLVARLVIIKVCIPKQTEESEDGEEGNTTEEEAIQTEEKVSKNM